MASVDDQLLGLPSARTPEAPATLDRTIMRSAVEKSRREDPEGGSKVMKVLYLDDSGQSVGEWASTQIPENPWDGQTMGGLQEPPYRMEQMVFLAEAHPIHSAALEQKTIDICGKGWEWAALDDSNADEDVQAELEAWFQSLAGGDEDEEDVQETLSSVWLDVETTGWGMFEVVRDPQGIVQKIYHVPAHTVRAHRNGFALCQVRDQRKVWFRRWGAADIQGKAVQVDRLTGQVGEAVRTPANDLFVIRKKSRRSTWYGIPGYISAIGWITLAMAARDDNLLFFANRREPRWAIILTGLSDDANIEEDIRRAFTVDLKQPYRNLILPISGPGKVDFQKLSDTAKDGSFEKLSERADKAIMVSHRTPSGRIANAEVGPLGGSNTVAENRIYKDGVVTPSQELLNNRLNKFIRVEYEKAGHGKPVWKIQMDDLDVSSEREDLDAAAIAFHGDLITLREARAKLRLGPLMKPAPVAPTEPTIDPETGLPAVDPITGLPVEPDPTAAPGDPPIDPETGDPVLPDEVESELNDMLYSQLPGTAGTSAKPGVPPTGAGGLSNPDKARGEIMTQLLDLDVREMISGSREVIERLEEMIQAARRADA